MPITIDNEEYLTMNEAAKYLGISYTTYRDFREREGIKQVAILGKGRAKYTKKSDLTPYRHKVIEVSNGR